MPTNQELHDAVTNVIDELQSYSYLTSVKESCGIAKQALGKNRPIGYKNEEITRIVKSLRKQISRLSELADDEARRIGTRINQEYSDREDALFEERQESNPKAQRGFRVSVYGSGQVEIYSCVNAKDARERAWVVGRHLWDDYGSFMSCAHVQEIPADEVKDDASDRVTYPTKV